MKIRNYALNLEEKTEIIVAEGEILSVIIVLDNPILQYIEFEHDNNTTRKRVLQIFPIKAGVEVDLGEEYEHRLGANAKRAESLHYINSTVLESSVTAWYHY